MDGSRKVGHSHGPLPKSHRRLRELAGINIHLEVAVDPREVREDRAVKEGIVTVAHLQSKLPADRLGVGKRVLNVDVSRRSEQEIGLQLADLIAGEARVFL
jgi:hypothetical protein